MVREHNENEIWQILENSCEVYQGEKLERKEDPKWTETERCRNAMGQNNFGKAGVG